jgi:hypothetical protein
VKPKAQLLAALAEVGVTPEDYQDIQRAQALVHKVNARLAARHAAVVYALTVCPAYGPRGVPWPTDFAET